MHSFIQLREMRVSLEERRNRMDIIEEKDFREHDKELIEKCIAAINKLPNCPNGHSGTYDKATIERTLRNVIDN